MMYTRLPYLRKAACQPKDTEDDCKNVEEDFPDHLMNLDKNSVGFPDLLASPCQELGFGGSQGWLLRHLKQRQIKSVFKGGGGNTLSKFFNELAPKHLTGCCMV